MRTFTQPRFRVDDHSAKYPFCPGKATWYPQIVRAYNDCRLAYYTGIMPKEGNLIDQDEFFAEVFLHFVDNFSERRYGRIWQDVNKVIPEVLKALGKMLGVKGIK